MRGSDLRIHALQQGEDTTHSSSTDAIRYTPWGQLYQGRRKNTNTGPEKV